MREQLVRGEVGKNEQLELDKLEANLEQLSTPQIENQGT